MLDMELEKTIMDLIETLLGVFIFVEISIGEINQMFYASP
jgi:hypothetical protein